MPQPTPVWFIWENGTFLIYTASQSQKHRNLEDNPHVALNYNNAADAETYLVIMGEAKVDHTAPDRLPAGAAKNSSIRRS